MHPGTNRIKETPNKLHMKRQVLLVIVLSVVSIHGISQEHIPVRTVPSEIFRSVKKDPNDTTPWKWKRGGIVNVNLAQGSLSNWAAGGDKFTMSLNAYVNYLVLNKGRNHSWDNSLDFNFGFLSSTSLGTRKNDDRFEILSKYGLKLDTSRKLFVSGLFNFRTQFFDGYTYSTETPTFSSTFFSPAYLFLSAGLDYKPFKAVSLFVSPITEKMTYVASQKIATKGSYGIPEGESVVHQFGAFASLNVYKQVFKNVMYKGKMDLFTEYTNNPENVDMFFTNYFTFKINKFLSATYNLDMIYDDDVKLFGENGTSPGLQLKSLIGIGFSMPITPVVN